jgi:hypothetical protein
MSKQFRRADASKLSEENIKHIISLRNTIPNSAKFAANKYKISTTRVYQIWNSTIKPKNDNENEQKLLDIKEEIKLKLINIDNNNGILEQKLLDIKEEDRLAEIGELKPKTEVEELKTEVEELRLKLSNIENMKAINEQKLAEIKEKNRLAEIKTRMLKLQIELEQLREIC